MSWTLVLQLALLMTLAAFLIGFVKSVRKG